MRVSRSAGVLVVLALLWAASLAGEPAAPPVRRVLILHSFGREFAPFHLIASGFRAELVERSDAPVDFYEVALETARYEGGDMDTAMTGYLKELFARRPPDLILTTAEPASLFFARHRAELFPGTPLLAIVNQRLTGQLAGVTNTVVVPVQIELPVLLENVLEVLPATTNVLMVLGNSPFERYWMAQCQEEFAPFTNRLTVTYASDWPLKRVLEQAQSLPPRSAVLYGMFAIDAAGVPHEQDHALARIHAAANAPMFGVLEHHLGNGIIGGRLVSMEQLGREAARVGLRRLAGAESVAARSTGPAAPVYDWRELKRWGIAAAQLPRGSEVRFYTPTFWETYKWRLIAIHLACLVEAVLIVVLVRSRRRWRRAEAALRESQQRLDLAAEAANLGLWVWDMKSNEIWVTEQGRRLFGRSPHEPLGFADFLASVHPDDRDDVQRAIKQAVNGTGQYHCEYRVNLPEGALRWIAGRGRIEFDAQHQPVRMRGTVIDLTDYKRTEADAKRSRDALAHASRVSTLGELSASLAHELNQPLSAILSNAQAAQRFLGQTRPDLAEVRGALQDIAEDGNRAGEVIRRMRGMVKRTAVELLPLDLNRLIHEVVELINSDAVIRNVTIELDLAPALPPVRGDSVQLQQVVLNLLLNAFDALNNNPVGERVVTVRTQRLANTARVSVQDLGTGLSAELQQRLFEPFHTTKAHGLGMGLTISRSIIEAHGGRLWGENNPPRGAIFSFDLPLEPQS